MFTVFGKCRLEEEKRRRLVYNKDDSTWYGDRRKWKRLSNSRHAVKQHPLCLLMVMMNQITSRSRSET